MSKTMQDSTISSIVVLVVYLYTRFPSIPGGDAGELLAEACHLGTAHPPGYPLFTVLSHLAIRLGELIWIPENKTELYKKLGSSSPANSVNILCCVLGAATCFIVSETVLLYVSVFQTNPNKKERKDLCTSHGAIAGVTFALSPLTWEYSIGVENFVLNNFLVSLIIYCTVSISTQSFLLKKYRHESYCKEQYRDLDSSGMNTATLFRTSLKGALICGLALSNQHTSLLFILPIAPYALWVLSRHMHRFKMPLLIGRLAIFFLFGLSPYVYLFLASKEPKPGSWGDMTTWKGFFRHIFRSEYGSLSLAAGGDSDEVEGSLIRWAAFFTHSIKQFSIVGISLSIIGIWIVYRTEWKGLLVSERPPVGSFLLAVLIFYLCIWNGIFSNLPLSVPMAFEVQSRFWIQPNILICIFIGIGSNALINIISFHAALKNNVVGRCLLLIIFFRCAEYYFKSEDTEALRGSSGGWIMHDYGKALLDSLPVNSLLLSYSDLNWNNVRYLQTCEARRSDVSHVSIQLLPFGWFARQTLDSTYKRVIFPTILPTVSTNRLDIGQKQLISRFLHANMKNGTEDGGIYIEMQAILETDIEIGGKYLDDFTLLPWGLVYRVLPRVLEDKNFEELRKKWHGRSWQQLTRIKKDMVVHATTNVRQGSWEFAAISVFWDMHYQLGMQMLSLALSFGSDLKEDHSLVVVYEQYLRLACKLLWQVDHVVRKRGTIR